MRSNIKSNKAVNIESIYEAEIRDRWIPRWTSCARALSLSALYCSTLISIASAQPALSSPDSAATPRAQTQLELTVKIPAVSPYAFGHDPAVLRGGLSHDHQTSSSPSLNVWRELFARIRASLYQNTQRADLSAEERETLTQLAQLKLPSSVEAWRDIGVDPSPRFWVYGLGLTPALTLEVRDLKRLEEWIERSLGGLNLGFKAVEHHRGRYWRKQMKRWVILARTQAASAPEGSPLSSSGIAHLALIPSMAEPVLLSYFLRDRERDHITDKLTRLSAQLPREAKSSGLIQLSSLIDLFFGSEVPLLMHSGRALGLPSPLFKSCDHDLRSISRAVPSLTFGLSSGVKGASGMVGGMAGVGDGTDTYHIHTLMELAPSSLSQLKRLTAEPPELWSHTASNALEIGLGVSPSALYQLLQRGLEEWRDHPWTCQPLKGFNALPKRLISPMVSAAMRALQLTRGVVLQLTYDSSRGGQQQGQQRGQQRGQQQRERRGINLSGWIEVAHDDPQQLIKLSSLLLSAPITAQADAQRKSEPQDVSMNFPHLAQPQLSTHDHHIIFSIGEWGAVAHRALLSSMSSKSSESSEGSSSPLPLFWFNIPPQLSEALKQWYEQAASSNQAQARRGQSQRKESRGGAQLRSARVDLSPDGVLIKSTLSIKAL